MLKRGLKICCFALLVLLLGSPSFAQNTKGDKPAPTPRETRFKTPKKAKKTKAKKQRTRKARPDADRAGQRVSPPSSRRQSRGERPGKPVGPQYSRPQPSDKQKPWKGDITGRRIRPRSSTERARNVHPQPPTTNASSSSELRRRPRDNENPNVKRVRRMQRRGDDKPRVGKPIRPVYHSTRPRHRERAWRGDITGRRIRATNADRVYSRTVPNRPRAALGGTRAGRQRAGIIPRLNGRAKNTYAGKNFYINNASRRSGRARQDNRRLTNLPQPRRQATAPGGRIIPRSASAPFLSRRSTNVWARFPRQKRKAEQAYTTDLAGRKLRTKNFETQRPVLTNPTLKYQKRVATGERPYQGPAGGYMSRSRSGRAWKGDVAHYRVRGGQPPGRERPFLGLLKGGGFRTATGPGPRGRLSGRPPGIGARGVGRYQGNLKAGRRVPFSQGELFSGNIKAGRRGFRNQGESYTGNIRAGKQGFRDQGEEYSGNIRTGRRGFRDQGEQYTGNMRAGRRGFRDQGEQFTGNIRTGRRGFRDQGEEYSGNLRAGKRGFRDQGEEYTGNIKAGRQGFRDQGEEYAGNLRAGRRGFRNQGEEYTGGLKAGKRGFSYQGEEHRGNIRRGRQTFNEQGEEYTGNIRFQRPLKGGGSVSGKLWNNNETPIPGKVYRDNAYRITRYSGNIKARRPEKGGGSVSGKLWNNNETPIPGKTYGGDAYRITRYSGNLRAKRPEKGGESISGKLWNNNERPIDVRTPKNREAVNYSGDIKLARNHYSRNPKSAAGAVPGVKASRATQKADVYARGVRRDWNYIHNPSSDDDARRVREPGRAFYRSTAYTGNIKMQRFDLSGKRELHPDAKFVKLNRNNVPGEKDALTNFKLWWARLFRKNETQPDHLKENGHTPRYDKGEAGLWYE